MPKFSSIHSLLLGFVASYLTIGLVAAQSELAPPRAMTPSDKPMPMIAAHDDPAPLAQPPKIDAEVWEYAKTHDVVPVFVTLAHQPQREILRKWEGTFAFRTEVARSRHKWAYERRLALPDELRAAQAEVDAVTMDIRRSASAEMQDATRPELDGVESTLLGLGATRIHRYTFITMVSALVPSSSLEELERTQSIAEVSLVHQGTFATVQSVPAFGAPTFWNAGFTGSGEAVAVLDSGVRESHPSFGGRVRSVPFTPSNLGEYFNCIGGDVPGSIYDFSGHGTHVAGILAGQNVPQVPGYIGVAPALSVIYNVKVGCTGSTGSATFNEDDVLKGIEAVLRLSPIRILNISLGAPNPGDDNANKMMDMLADMNGATVVVSAGNEGPAALSVTSPGDAHNIISVANAMRSTRGAYDAINISSSRGPTVGGRRKPDLAAPGTDIYSARHNYDNSYPYNLFISQTGTSMAAPHVAGAAALLRQSGVTTPREIKAVLLNTADKDPTDNTPWKADRGWGFANLTRAHQQLTSRDASWVTGRSGLNPFRFYRGPAGGGLRATLVWNRYVVGSLSTLSDLDLSLFNTSNTLLSSSISIKDNVEQVSTSVNSDVVLKVSAYQTNFQLGLTAEPFALAVSRTGFTRAVGPQLSVSCSAPSAVAPSAAFTVSCTARNDGDLDAFSTTGLLNFAGSTGGGTNDFGKLSASGGSATRFWNATAPSTLGPFQMIGTVGSVSYEETFLASTNLTITTSTSGCTITLGSSGQTVSSAAATGSLTITASSNTCGWTATSNAGWLTINGSASGTGNGSLSYSVAANSSSTRTGVLTIGGATFTITQNGTGSITAGTRFTQVTPCRVVDTRLTNGPLGGPFLSGGGSRSFNVPSSTCGIPSSALAYSVNVTVVPRAGSLGYLTIWPTGQAQPLVSTLNAGDGRIVANAAIVPAGTNGAISVFATNDTDVIIDINGYFSAATGLAFYPVTPCRVVDTRNAAGALGGPSIGSGQSRSFPVPASPCSIPTLAKAYSMNFTVVPTATLGYLSTWPSGQAQPFVSTLNLPEGGVVANAAIVPAGTNGAISVFVTDKTDVIIDVNGYFADAGGAGALSFYPATPCRVSDTRSANGPLGGPALTTGGTRVLPVPSAPCGVPSNAKAYSTNFTVVPGGSLGYLTTWPTGVSQPFVSTLNSGAGKVLANAAIVPTGTDGAISVYVTNPTDVIVDLNGYFAP